MEQFFDDLLSGKKRKTNLIDQLYKQPKRDINGDNTTFTRITPNYIQFLDTLYLPNDKGYIYALVLTDQGSRLVDMEPMLSRSSSDIVKAIKAIYKRKIILKPKVIVTDNGSEFKKDFDSALISMDIGHKTAKTQRSRSLALVERKNQTIGKLIHKVLIKSKLAGQNSSQWVSYCRPLINAINKKVVEKEKLIKITPIEKQNITYNKNQPIKMLKIGDRVRVQLDKPVDLNNKPLNGNFRASDIKFNPEIKTIKNIIFEPNEPIMYFLNGNVGPLKIDGIGYTYNQLLKVSDQEKNNEPIINEDNNRYELNKLLERKKVGRYFQYLVLWKNMPRGNNRSWEKRSNLVEDLGQNFMNKQDLKFDKIDQQK